MAKYTDLNLSFLPHPIKKDINKLVDIDALKRSVLHLVMTNHYERPFHPEIGSGIRALLFENYTPITNVLIQRQIEDVINNFEPRVKVERVTVLGKPEANGLEVKIYFSAVNISEVIELNLFLERVR